MGRTVNGNDKVRSCRGGTKQHNTRSIWKEAERIEKKRVYELNKAQLKAQVTEESKAIPVGPAKDCNGTPKVKRKLPQPGVAGHPQVKSLASSTQTL
jgi:hypothetical protein